nr:unnamed protein product [Callosobruchus analis]
MHLPSRLVGRILRHEHQRLSAEPVSERRSLHGRRGRLHVHVRTRLHGQEMPTYHRLLLVETVPERRHLHRSSGRLFLQM